MEQTNRTILFEEINPDKGDILTYIQDDMKESIEDSILRKINQCLEVSSFHECIEKLQPVLYICLETEEKDVLCIAREAEIKALQATGNYDIYQIQFDENYPLLKYYINLIDKKVPELENLEAQIVKLMFPFHDEEIFRMDYTKILSLYVSGKIDVATKELQCFTKKYQNAFMLLYMIIQMTSEELEGMEEKVTTSKIIVSDQLNMQIGLCKVSDAFLQRKVCIPEKDVEYFQLWLEENLEHVGNKMLLNKLFSIRTFGAKYEEFELVNLYYETLDYYIRIIEIYWNHSRPLLEKLLGIYTYFAHYQVRRNGMSPKLLITNVTPTDMLNIRNRNKLRLFFNSTNGKIYSENVIWYAIIPHLEYIDEERSGNIRERFGGNQKSIVSFANNLDDIKSLMHILSEYKIQTFISPISGQHSSTQWVLRHGVEEWITFQRNFMNKDYAEYLYPCFPNFSLSYNPYLELKIEKSKSWKDVRVKKEGRQNLWLKEISIEASYVAAGIYAAIQCPVFLQEHIPNKINVQMPGIGFRILENDVNKMLPSILKANVFLLPQDVIEDIDRRCCGVFFSSYGNKMFVIQDNAMSKMYGEKNTISTVQTLTYIERKLRYETQDFKAELIEVFFQKKPGSLMDKWNQNRDFYNSVLKKGETIQYQLNKEHRECIIEVSFDETKCQRRILLN